MQTLKVTIFLVLLIGCTSGISMRTLGRNRKRSKRTHDFIKTHLKPVGLRSALKQLKTQMEIRGIQRINIANQDCWYVKNYDQRISISCSDYIGGTDFFGQIGEIIGFDHPDHLSIGINGKH